MMSNNSFILSGSTQGQEKEDILEARVGKKAIILYNDDFNTFDFVIQSLIEVCEHEPVQAEQCTYLVHFKGKCDVMHGTEEQLEKPCRELNRRGLTAKIES